MYDLPRLRIVVEHTAVNTVKLPVIFFTHSNRDEINSNILYYIENCIIMYVRDIDFIYLYT